MSLPTPLDLWKYAQGFVRDVFFFVVMIIILLPVVQLGLIFGGILVALCHHLVIGLFMFAAGLIGTYLNKNLQI